MILTDIEKREYDRYFSYYDFSKELENKTFLITGAKGIIGNALLKWLLYYNQLYKTNIKIIASTRNENDVPDYIEKNDNVEFCKFNYEVDYVKDRSIDYIIHMASSTSNKFFKSNPVEATRVILEPSIKLLELAKEKDSSFIYLSSEEVYGQTDTEEPIDENYVGRIDSLNTRSCYPLGKKLVELLCVCYAKEYNVDTKILRPSVINGLTTKYDEERVDNEILRCILENRNLILKSKGETKKCMIYTLDVISALLIVLLKGEKGNAYNVSNPDTFMSIYDRANYLFDIFNKNCKVEIAEEDTSINAGFLPKRQLKHNVDKLMKLGWKERTSLDNIYGIDVERLKNNYN